MGAPTVTGVTSNMETHLLEWLHLSQSRLEGISSGYWTPSEKRLQGFVSSGSSTLVPSAGLRPAECQRSPDSVTLTLGANSSTILIVSQAACQCLACNEN